MVRIFPVRNSQEQRSARYLCSITPPNLVMRRKVANRKTGILIPDDGDVRMTSTSGIANPAALDGQIDEVIRSAQRELAQLLTQRAELVKRIGTVKQTLVHMARLF